MKIQVQTRSKLPPPLFQQKADTPSLFLIFNRIYDSTVTAVLISKNMVDARPEKEQWIPREISYSLTENNRGDRVSHTNAMLAVLLPDESGSYGYFLQENNCCNRWPCCPTFQIISANMFNYKRSNAGVCVTGHGNVHNVADPGYVHLVKWRDFTGNIGHHIDRAIQIQENIDNYNVQKRIL